MPYNKEAEEQFQKKYKLTVSSARNRLMRAIMFALLQESDHHFCYRCGEEMTLEDFTIEHIEPWAYSDDAWDLYFDLSNIAFSHSKCNSSHARRYTEHTIAHRQKHFGATCTDETKRTRRCYECKKWKPFDEFILNASKRFGIGYICKVCRPGQRRRKRKEKLDTNNQ